MKATETTEGKTMRSNQTLWDKAEHARAHIAQMPDAVAALYKDRVVMLKCMVRDYHRGGGGVNSINGLHGELMAVYPGSSGE